MASQLRFILLGLGIVLIAGLWWWERRRGKGPSEDAALRAGDRFEPRIETEGHSPDLNSKNSASDAPIRAHEERPVPRGNPPLVTIEDLPENTDSVVLAPEPISNEAPVTPPAIVAERRRYRPDPPPAPEPLEEPTAEGLIETVAPEPERAPAEPPPRQQRIVAIRLIGDRERRIDGGELKKALGAEGLEFGRYSIFHRVMQGGRPVYSVASLVEPGSFDETAMGSAQFPGISMFAVYPGPMPAPQAFDEMLATARRLADRLGGALQDDSGSSLTGQRVLSIREELVHFEHLVALSRSRPEA